MKNLKILISKVSKARFAKRAKIAIALIFFPLNVFAIVSPRHFVDPERKLNLHAASTDWDFFGSDDSSSRSGKNDLEVQFVARAPQIIADKIQSTLTLRIDKGDWQSSHTYAERWLREYPKFGYELMMSRQANFGNLEGFEMELRSPSSDRRIRQFVVKRPHEMWIFTCSSDIDHFDFAWKSCEKILQTARTN